MIYLDYWQTDFVYLYVMWQQKEDCKCIFLAEFVAKSNSLRLNSRNNISSRHMIDDSREENEWQIYFIFNELLTKTILSGMWKIFRWLLNA